MQTASGAWECAQLAQSYAAFLEKSGIQPQNPRDPLPLEQVLNAAERISGGPVRLIAADLPLSKQRILTRRVADNAVSQKFGRCKCATHSPTKERPGELSNRYRVALEAREFRLATSLQQLQDRALIEVYPHPALLSLMNAHERIPYKWSKRSSYWPSETPAVRRSRIFDRLEQILEALSREILQIPLRVDREARGGIKGIEDQLDALICAWVGILALEGKAAPLGDDQAAIWVPRHSLRIAEWSGLLTGVTASPEYMQDAEDPPPEERSFFTTSAPAAR